MDGKGRGRRQWGATVAQRQLVFNRTIGLRDGYARTKVTGGP